MSALRQFKEQRDDAPAPLDVLKIRAASRALLWAEGLIETIPAAVDPLQEFAETSGLVAQIGQGCVQKILSDTFLPYREAEWLAQAEIDQTPAEDERAADAPKEAEKPKEPQPRERPTPQVTVEAVMWTVRERGLKALKEAANLERLQRSDSAARDQINDRVRRLSERGELK